MFDDILGNSQSSKKRIKSIFQECVHCNKPFLAYEGHDIPIDDQPCPYCFTSKSGKKWDNDKKKFIE